MELHARIQENIREHSLLEPGAHVLVAVSGGVDSMALLHMLHKLGLENGWDLEVAHFNHLLRGNESNADEKFVRSAAEQLKLPVSSAAGDVRAHAERTGVSIEMAARELRHGFLVETAQKLRIKHIALAHHADDQVETIWLRLLRGDVGAGLGGIRWKRAAGANAMFVRPLLNIWKAELRAYAADQQIDFREDASNLETHFLRNRLRLEVLPVLDQFQPALREISLRTAEIFAADKAFLEREAERWLNERHAPFSELHTALQREVVRIQLVAMGVRPRPEWIEKLRERAEVPVCVGANAQFVRTLRGEILRREIRESSFVETEACAQLGAEGRMHFDGVEFQWKLVEHRAAPEPGVEFFDAKAVGSVICLRHWQPGDRFQPIGFEHETKLQDQFTNLKVAPVEKRRRIVAATESGKVFWVEGLRISEQHKVRPETRAVLRWKWRRRD